MNYVCIDGGGTKVQAARVKINSSNSIDIIEPIIERKYLEHKSYNPNFIPISIDDQKRNHPILDIESHQGMVIIKTIVQIIKDLNDDEDIKIAIAMPGEKTSDKRGIKIMKNGPRMMNFCKELEAQIPNLVKPIIQIENDSKMCGLGENIHNKGSFRNIKNGYYLGGGTGLAECLKLNGNIFDINEIKDWIGKAWELKTANGYDFETLSSLKGINKLINKGKKKDIAIGIADLILERITTVHHGWEDQFIIDRKLKQKHPYLNNYLDRIIIGQQLSIFLDSDNDGIEIFNTILNIFESKLKALNGQIKDFYLDKNSLKSDFIVLSKLRKSPLIGLGSTLLN